MTASLNAEGKLHRHKATDEQLHAGTEELPVGGAASQGSDASADWLLEILSMEETMEETTCKAIKEAMD